MNNNNEAPNNNNNEELPTVQVQLPAITTPTSLIDSARAKAVEFEKTLPFSELQAAKKSFDKFLNSVYTRGYVKGMMQGSIGTALVFTLVAVVVRL